MTKANLIANTRRALRESPKEIFNFYLIFSTLVVAFSGIAKGYDEGNIASIVVTTSFRQKFGVEKQSANDYANTKGWIVSIATAGAVFGCLSCTWLTSRLGRKRPLQLYTVFYIAGVLGQVFASGSLAGFYISRVIAGFGIGGSTIVPSVYLSEIAPTPIRGLITVSYSVLLQFGVMAGFFVNYGVTKYHPNTDLQWQLPTALQLIPAVMWLAGTFFIVESPRWLLSVGRRDQAIVNLRRLRKLPEDHPLMVEELTAVESQIFHEAEMVTGHSQWSLAKETFGSIQNRRRFILMLMAHAFSQWSGANAITQYSPTIFGYLGITGTETAFLATGIYGLVKFLATLLFALVIVDFIGRRRSLITGICMQIITLSILAAYLGATNNMTAAQIKSHPASKHASTVAIVAIFVHSIAWAIGWFSAPYLINSEIFPVRIRGFNMSIMMAIHWLFYFGCSKATPTFLVASNRWGAFAFFAIVCTISLVFVYFCMPETAGRSLESLDSLFDRPLYTIRKVAYPSMADFQHAGNGTVKDYDNFDVEEKKSDHVEHAREL